MEQHQKKGHAAQPASVDISTPFWTELTKEFGEPRVKYDEKEGVKRLVGVSFNRLLEQMLLEWQRIVEEKSTRDDTPPALFSRQQTVGFFLSYQWYTTASSLLEKLLVDVARPCTFQELDRTEILNTELKPHLVPDIVVRVIRWWMVNRADDWRNNTELQEKWPHVFAQIEEHPLVPENVKHILQTLKRAFEKCVLQSSGPSASTEDITTTVNSGNVNLFSEIPVMLLATHLTWMEHQLFRKIDVSEFVGTAWTKHKDGVAEARAGNIIRSILMFNNLTLWVSAVVLQPTFPDQRAAMIARMLRLAVALRDMNNFSSLMAVHSALSHVSVHRLRQTISKLDRNSKATWAELDALLTTEMNYEPLRQATKAVYEAGQGGIPYLGLLLRDMVYVEDAHPTVVDGLLNVRKLDVLASMFQPFVHFQVIRPHGEVTKSLMNFIALMLEPRVTTDELYELSLQREPKTPRKQSAAASFMEGALGSLYPVTGRVRAATDPSVGVNVPSREAVAAVPPAEDDGAEALVSQLPPELLFALECTTTQDTDENGEPPHPGTLLERLRSPAEVMEAIDGTVQAIFSTYDLDDSGGINRNEFEVLQTNLPFLEKFASIDTNGDGVITREELRAYLASACLLDFGPSVSTSPLYSRISKGFTKGLRIAKQTVLEHMAYPRTELGPDLERLMESCEIQRTALNTFFKFDHESLLTTTAPEAMQGQRLKAAADSVTDSVLADSLKSSAQTFDALATLRRDQTMTSYNRTVGCRNEYRDLTRKYDSAKLKVTTNRRYLDSLKSTKRPKDPEKHRKAVQAAEMELITSANQLRLLGEELQGMHLRLVRDQFSAHLKYHQAAADRLSQALVLLGLDREDVPKTTVAPLPLYRTRTQAPLEGTPSFPPIRRISIDKERAPLSPSKTK